MAIGKDYRKNDPLEGAALFVLSLERSGASKIGGASDIVRATLRDLGVSEDEVAAYISQNRPELEQKLTERLAR